MVHAFDNQDYQFDDMIDNLKMKRVVGKTSLIDTLFQFQNLQLNNPGQGDLQMEPYEIDVKSSKFDLEIYVLQMEQTLKFSINYRNSLFKKETIDNLVKDYKQLVEIILENPYRKIKNIDIHTSKDWQKNTKDLFETVTFDI
jgi:non-ribosomal peptide synthetase component F